MWVFTPSGFLSVVINRDAKDDGDALLVRARMLADIQHFTRELAVNGASAMKIVEMFDSDYRYRCTASKTAVAAYLLLAVHSIDYDNFKSAVLDVQHHDAYLRVWAACMNGLRDADEIAAGNLFPEQDNL